jgi:predicted amidohydrolase YtcJ
MIGPGTNDAAPDRERRLLAAVRCAAMDEPGGVVFADVEVIGCGRVDVSVRAGRIAAIGAVEPGRPVIAGHGRALLPGLHDHHLHVLATAASRTSVDCGPPRVRDRVDLARALGPARPHRGWIRGVGYHESVAGDLDATSLDRVTSALPTRVQHRSGALWVVNGPGVRALGLDDVQLTGVERDAGGRPTGRLWRMDDWLRERIGVDPAPDVAGVSAELARGGVTAVTDATADLTLDAVEAIVAGGFEQGLLSLGRAVPAGVGLGPRKIVVADHQLPSFDELVGLVHAARPRAVALHCVTRAALALTLAVLSEVGAKRGDRIEHAAVGPPELARAAAALGVTVVTQPGLVRERGDDYLDDVEADDQPFLWPFASLLAAGVRVGCSSDAPYGGLDPWASVAAAVARRSASGRLVAGAERVDAWTALRGYLSPLADPGGRPRAVAVGAPADLCLLDRPLADALRAPEQVAVVLTARGGRIIHGDSALAGRA